MPKRRRSADSALWRLSSLSDSEFFSTRNARRSLRLVKAALSGARDLLAVLELERVVVAGDMGLVRGQPRGKRPRR